MLIDSVRNAIKSGPGRLRVVSAYAVAAGAIAAGLYAGMPADAVAALPGGGSSAHAEALPVEATGAVLGVDELEARVAELTGAWRSVSEYYDDRVAPIQRVLHRFSSDSALVRDISVALIREADRVDVEPRLLLAVLLVENPWLDPDIRSPVGAIGLMQVMPVHRGGWSQCGQDLEDIDSNICHGAHIFAHYFRGSGGNIDRALLRYNGCVRGTNTPDCHQYPNHVFAHAGRASVLSWLGQAGPGAAAP